MSDPLRAVFGRITNSVSYDNRDGDAGNGLTRVAPFTLTTAS